MAKYSNTSPYFDTREIADYLDILNPRTITAEQDDQRDTAREHDTPGVVQKMWGRTQNYDTQRVPRGT